MNTLNDLPEVLTVDQIIDHVIFIEKVEKGLADSSNNNVYTKEEVKSKLEKWLK